MKHASVSGCHVCRLINSLDPSQPQLLTCHRREALDSGNFEAGASYIDTFMDLEEKYGPVSDGDGQQAAEQEQVCEIAQHALTACHSGRFAGKHCMMRVSCSFDCRAAGAHGGEAEAGQHGAAKTGGRHRCTQA